MDTALLDLRREGIGGSDIAAIVGLNPWRNAHDLWLEKVGFRENDEGQSEAAYWGQQLEDIICQEYSRREHVRLVRLPVPHGIVHDPKDPWIMGSPDRMVDGCPIGMDAKMAGLRQSGRWGAADTDHVPDEYLLQCQWYLRLTRSERWDIGVLLGQEFRIYRINPHPGLQEALVDIAARFWFDHVIPKVPPPIDHSAGARRLLEALYPMQRDEIRPATDEEVALAAQLRDATRDTERAEMRQARLRNLLCDYIGLAEGIVGPDFKLTWKRTKDSRITDWEAVARIALKRLDIDAAEQIVTEHTAKRPGQRRFRAAYHADGDD